MDTLPIQLTLLSDQIRPTQVLGIFVADQTFKEEGEWILGLFDSVVESACNNSILNPTELLRLSLNDEVIVIYDETVLIKYLNHLFSERVISFN